MTIQTGPITGPIRVAAGQAQEAAKGLLKRRGEAMGRAVAP
jgi:hypothetical protein